MNKIQKIRKNLASFGINKAQADAGTCEGRPAVFLRWNGNEDVVTDSTPDEVIEHRYVPRYADENLQ